MDQIYLKEMILPLVVVDVHEECAKKPDYTLTLGRLKKWETDHGKIPSGAFVAMRTDWSKRWPDAAKMENKDDKGVAHYPGWSLATLRFLYEERKITASGHETTDTDPGIATTRADYSLETYILSTNHYQIELLTNLDQVPEAGALAIVSFPKPQGGSGFAARGRLARCCWTAVCQSIVVWRSSVLVSRTGSELFMKNMCRLVRALLKRTRLVRMPCAWRDLDLRIVFENLTGPRLVWRGKQREEKKFA